MICAAYFTCGRHFQYIHASIQSLALVGSGHVNRIWIGVDEDDPFSESQCAELRKHPLSVDVERWPKVTGHGVSSVLHEMRAMRNIALESDSFEWIAKVDSDVLFVGNAVFRKVHAQSSDLYGQKEAKWSPLVYTQGGCYFMRADWLRSHEEFTVNSVRSVSEFSLAALNKRATELESQPIHECPEDLAVHNLVCRDRGGVSYGSYYVPTWQIPRLQVRAGRMRICHLDGENARLSLVQSFSILLRDQLLRMGRYSVVHFQYHKNLMVPFSNSLLLLNSAGMANTC